MSCWLTFKEMSIVEGWSAPVPWNINIKQTYESYSSPESVDSQYELPNTSSGYHQTAMLSQPPSQSPLMSNQPQPQPQPQPQAQPQQQPQPQPQPQSRTQSDVCLLW